MKSAPQKLMILAILAVLVLPLASSEGSADLEKYLDCLTDKKVDIVFVFDTTNSMGGEINELSAIARDFAADLEASHIDYQLGLLEFRDFPQTCDGSSCGSPGDFAYRVKGNGTLTSEIDTFGSWMKELKAGGGGSGGPEAVLAALRHAGSDILWRDDAEKVIILLTDAGPHPDGSCCNAEGDTLDGTIFGLSGLGARVNVIGPDDASLKRIAENTGGQFYQIRSGLSLKPLLKEITGTMSCSFRVDVEATCEERTLAAEVRLVGKEAVPYKAGQTEAWMYLDQAGSKSRYNLSYDQAAGAYLTSISEVCGSVELTVYGRVGERSAVQTVQVECRTCGDAAAEAASNRPPEMIGLVAEPMSSQEAGTAVTWTAEATDPDGDQMLYRFMVNDGPTTDWQAQNQWTWNASDVGTYRIEVQVRDGKHAGENGMDDRKASSFEILGHSELQTIDMNRDNEAVVFPDPNLDAAVRDAIDKPEGSIYIEDLADLNSLTANQSDIKDIAGLEHCKSLQYLNLWKNKITDVSPLSGLTNLQELYLGENQIADVSPLSGLTNLPELSLFENQITDVSPLSDLTNLQELILFENQITDVSPLSDLTNLQRLDLGTNQITDVSPLSGLANLQYLDLWKNKITDVSPLSGLTNLQYLDLEENQITDVSPLSGLTNLNIDFSA